MTATLDRTRLTTLIREEERRFTDRHPQCRELFERGGAHMLDGVPMNWMARHPNPFPLFVREAQGVHLTCVDGHDFLDFCLGDTGAMAGHAPPPTVRAIAEQAARGITTMMATEDSLWVAAELARRFGLQYWQVVLTATDANRNALRIARHITGRPKVLTFNWCYHGSVDEALAVLSDDGSVIDRPGSVGPPVTANLNTKVIEFNDVAALERALEPGDVAAVLAEPALTNIGIVLPEPGYLDALRRVTRDTGTLLIIDETHTICAGPGGCTQAWGLEPDLVTLGKPIGGGVPCAVFGFGQAVVDAIHRDWDYKAADESGIGGTLAGNALSLAAMKATLGEVLTEAAFARMIPLGERFCDGVQAVIDDFELPWVVNRLGCRTEYWPCPVPPRNGGEASAVEDDELHSLLHLFTLNRGILMTPFHNMALMAPTTTEEDVDRHTAVLREAVVALFG